MSVQEDIYDRLRKQQIDEDPGSYSKHSSLEHVVVILHPLHFPTILQKMPESLSLVVAIFCNFVICLTTKHLSS